MFILKNEHQPGVYVPLRALFLVFNVFYTDINALQILLYINFIVSELLMHIFLGHLSRRLKGELIVYQSSCRLL